MTGGNYVPTLRTSIEVERGTYLSKTRQTLSIGPTSPMHHIGCHQMPLDATGMREGDEMRPVTVIRIVNHNTRDRFCRRHFVGAVHGMGIGLMECDVPRAAAWSLQRWLSLSRVCKPHANQCSTAHILLVRRFFDFARSCNVLLSYLHLCKFHRMGFQRDVIQRQRMAD